MISHVEHVLGPDGHMVLHDGGQVCQLVDVASHMVLTRHLLVHMVVHDGDVRNGPHGIT